MAASQLDAQLGSAQESAASFAQASEQACVRSGRPDGGPSYQQRCIAASSLSHTPDFGAGCPLALHWKLDAGCIARQSVAAVTSVAHHEISDFVPCRPP